MILKLASTIQVLEFFSNSDFIKQFELIQAEMLQLQKEIDLNFSPMLTTQNETTITNASKLQVTALRQLFDSDDEVNEDENKITRIDSPVFKENNPVHQKKSSKKHQPDVDPDLMIPDTCPTLQSKQRAVFASSTYQRGKYIIRDTIDDNYSEIFVDQNQPPEAKNKNVNGFELENNGGDEDDEQQHEFNLVNKNLTITSIKNLGN